MEYSHLKAGEPSQTRRWCDGFVGLNGCGSRIRSQLAPEQVKVVGGEISTGERQGSVSSLRVARYRWQLNIRHRLRPVISSRIPIFSRSARTALTSEPTSLPFRRGGPRSGVQFPKKRGRHRQVQPAVARCSAFTRANTDEFCENGPTGQSGPFSAVSGQALQRGPAGIVYIPTGSRAGALGIARGNRLDDLCDLAHAVLDTPGFRNRRDA